MNGIVESDFPNLRHQKYKVTSPATTEYNCIAWAAGDASAWWWPDSLNQYYWPSNVQRAETVGAFIKVFESLSYTVSDSGEFEEGYEKIAIYVKERKPTHAARQINAKYWTSKLGRYIDIEHEIDGVSDSKYGSVAAFMKRPLPK